VIQKIGQEAFGYTVATLPKRLIPEGSGPTAEDLKNQKLQKVAVILGHTIETLRLRASMWLAAKERALAASLTTYSDAEKVQKILEALDWEELPIPAIDASQAPALQLATLKTDRNVVELLRTKAKLRQQVENPISDPQKQTAIKTHALTVDADVTGTRGMASRRFDYQTLMDDPILKMHMTQNDLELVGSNIQTKEGKIVLITLYQGDAAFVQQTPAGAGMPRAVYTKLGKDPGRNNEYVKDDKGVFTRRYAYVEKNKYQFRDLANQGKLEGRFSQDPVPRSPRAYNAIDKKAREQVRPLPGGNVFTDAYQLAYVHQELGSGPQQRGVSATSTPRHAVFSNQGKSFRTRDGVRIEVDLARVPVGTNQAPQLINHYARAAQDKMVGVTNTSAIFKRGRQDRKFAHYQWSVKKNRELFIKDVQPGYISALTLHQTATGSSHTEASPTGFTQRDVQTLGQKVGLQDYNAGFLRGSTSAAQERGKSKYYDEGYADGVEYLRGWNNGDPMRRGVPIPKGDDKIREIQGFWDRRNGRPKRTN
jgi:hypothetical protein